MAIDYCLIVPQGLRPGLKAGVPGGTLNSACLRLA